MNVRHSSRVISALVVGALALSAIAPAAEADSRRSRDRDRGQREYRHKKNVRRDAPRHVERRRGNWDDDGYRRPAQRHRVETRVVYQPRHIVKYVDYRPHRVVRHARYHRPHDGSAFAFFGGLLLGAAITHVAHADHYYYADPYCDLHFSNLDAYDWHLAQYHHPRVVHVVEIRTGDWVDSYRYHGGDWRYYNTERWCSNDDDDDDWEEWDDD